MDIQTLKNFIKLAETLHFTKASEQVFMAQPALSRQIKQLEQSIGAELFKRNKRNVSLTQAGVYFKEAARQTIDQLNYAINRTKQIHSGQAGEIKIGYTHSIVQTILPRIIKEIRAEFPDVKTILREMNNNEQCKDLAEQKIDIGFATNPIVPENLKSKIFFEDVFVVVLPENHYLLKEKFRDFSAFSKETFILPHEIEGSDYVYTVESICLDAGFFPNVVHHTSSVSSALKLVEAGLGITIEPRGSLSGQNLAIKFIELDNITQKAQSVILWNENTEKENLPILQLIKRIINL
ncbi:MAG: LysR substrate-binding domain-containing protein [Ginsengibacter sp.]